MHCAAPALLRCLRLLPLSLAALLAACGGGEGPPDPVEAARACREQVNDQPGKLLACVTLEGVRAHQVALADIAHAHGGSRATGTPGYDASVDYVAGVLRDAGYAVTVQPLRFHAYQLRGASQVEQLAPQAQRISHVVLKYSGSVEVTAPLATPADIAGCRAADYAGFIAGHIALVRAGGCSLHTKATLAWQAGAAAMVAYNDAPGQLFGGMEDDFEPDFAAFGLAGADGERLLAEVPAGVVLHLKAGTVRSWQYSANVLAESRGGDPGQVVMLGAHLDSVAGSPGINDNGSGVAAVLETAVQMGRVQPRNRLRFAFWGAEEQGLVGSTRYLRDLDAAERGRIALYLNFDMIGSPNHLFALYFGAGQPQPGVAPRTATARAIQRALGGYHHLLGLPVKPSDIGDRSDHRPFDAWGIPWGGLESGFGDRKRPAEADLWGGTPSAPYDPCYHKACDGLANYSPFALEVNADAIAWAALQLSMQALPR